jgi:hypothetical protein
MGDMNGKLIAEKRVNGDGAPEGGRVKGEERDSRKQV